VDVLCNLQLPGIEQALAALLPKGVTPLRIHLDQSGFALDAKAPMVGTVHLTAEVSQGDGHLRLHHFLVKGAGVFNGVIETQLHNKIAALDLRRGALRVSGDSEGHSVNLSWGA